MLITKAEILNEFPVGQNVVLKSNPNVVMTVEFVQITKIGKEISAIVKCCWFNESKELQRNCFDCNAIKKR